MTETAVKQSLPPDLLLTPALTQPVIASHSRFPEAEALMARVLIGMQEKTPRLTRLKSSHRKWLLTHSLYALASQRDPADPLSGLTASRLIDVVVEIGAASRNTASAFLQEMLTYKFLREVPDVPDRRVRILELTDISILGMKTWFDAHMAGLDLMDGGNRCAVCAARPQLFPLAQRHAAAILTEDPDWREPRDTIETFFWSDAGSMVLHHLITRLESADYCDGRFTLGALSLSDLAQKFSVSVSNVKRMFAKAEKDGLAGWSEPRRRGVFWISEVMLADYFHSEAAKFAALDAAIHVVAGGTEGKGASVRRQPPHPSSGPPDHLFPVRPERRCSQVDQGHMLGANLSFRPRQARGCPVHTAAGRH